MIMELEELQARAEEEIDAARTEEALLAVRTKYLGRKGLLTAILRHIGTAQPEERQRIGKRSNEIKEALSSRIDQRLLAAAAAGQEAKLQREKVDCTLPGRALRYGRLHPVTQVCHEICEIFGRLGFSVEEGPEVETDRYNFEALNIPPDHPARDMQDTFYIEEGIVLRTHTSPVQVRTMERVRPPIRILSPVASTVPTPTCPIRPCSIRWRV
jgi:phenylalanyl-tRNA synthetase alpha chain